MTQPLAAHVGRPQTVEALGRTWTLSRWTRAVWRDFLQWAKPLLPDPRETAQGMLDRIPAKPENDQLRREIVRDALEKAEVQLTPADPRVTRLIGTTDGMIQLVTLLLKPAHKEATEDDAYDLIMTVGPERMNELLSACAGVVVPKDGTPPSQADPPSS